MFATHHKGSPVMDELASHPPVSITSFCCRAQSAGSPLLAHRTEPTRGVSLSWDKEEVICSEG